ncbi:GDSL-type esterase/lipase family protein [Clostridium sp. SHJSY1]|uniref:GDSL-type esterase/lipase family protein n=1 Tax=Clostridium sp. SHJSY1 TaxID=2942483 RepID=UPI002876BD00|nr:GDSL-type esterase/lipase family protein [Clostridium sp. SHJSY1]MDS0524822.1 GDSL-type esterase/lipase family protein [Clostridium sp. SHJSY1]
MYLDDLNKDKYTLIEANDCNYEFNGRIDFQNKKAPTMIYAGSLIKTKFQGTTLKIAIKNNHLSCENAIGYIIDGTIHGKAIIDEENKDIVLEIINGLENKTHDLILYKRSDSYHYFDFYGVILDKGCTILFPGTRLKRRMECFGDSISAGELSEAIDYVGKEDPENHDGRYSNAWYSYSMMTARNLKAEINNNAQGGLAVLNGTGYFREGEYLGLEFTYDKLRYNPQLGYCNSWDFLKFTPHVVIMALGQNDAHPDNYINADKERRHIWKEKYKGIIKDLRSKYPNALFVVITTILCHDKGWDEALDEMVEELEDTKIVRYLFKRNGIGTPGHVRIPEAEEMANELTNFIESFGEEIWK